MGGVVFKLSMMIDTSSSFWLPLRSFAMFHTFATGDVVRLVVASIIFLRLVLRAKIRFSEQKTKIFLSFFERMFLNS